MNLRKRWLAIAMTLFMTASLTPTSLFAVSASAASDTSSTTDSQGSVTAETYSDLGLNTDVTDESLYETMGEKQPYGDAVEGYTVATNVINELYVNFNGSVSYGWSIMDDIPMQYRNGKAVNGNWTSSDNSYGAMGYWRSGLSVSYKNGNKSVGALDAEQNGTYDSTQSVTNTPTKRHELGSSITSQNTHLTNQYSLSEAFSPGTGKDNYVAELVVNYASKVYLKIYKVEGGTKTLVRSKEVGTDQNAGSGVDDETKIYSWEYDSMYELAAGDMDGDGYDEIALYFGNKVYIYAYKNGTLTELTTYSITAPSGSFSSKQFNSAVVTLAFGDFNADGNDELAVAQSMTYGATNQDKAGLSILKLEKAISGTSTTYSLSSLKTVSFANDNSSAKDDEKIIRYVNVAAGDIDNDYIDELVIAGYSSENKSNATCKNKTNVWYQVVELTAESKNSSNVDSATDGWKSTSFVKKDMLGNLIDNTKQVVTPIALECAATQGEGYAEQIFLAGCLYSFESDGTLKYLTEMTTNREYKKNNGDKQNKDEKYIINTVAGNFNGNAYGQEQIICVFVMKDDSGKDQYWFDIAYINKDKPGDTDASDTKAYWYGQEQVLNYESMYNYNANKTRSGLYVSLAAVDCDDDSTLMKYKNASVSYSDPEVYAVLQSTPYFEDVEENMEYLDEGGTSFGKEKTSTTSATAGGSLSAGMYVSYEQDISVFGIKIGSVEAEAQYKHTFSYDFEYSETVTTSVEYTAKTGDDYVVVYTVPYMLYNYEIYVPEVDVPKTDAEWEEFLSHAYEGWSDKTSDEKAKLKEESKKICNGKTKIGGYWDPCTISVPMTPSTVILTVDKYDEIASESGLDVIRGKILDTTPGQPETYKNPCYTDNFNVVGDKNEWQLINNTENSNTKVSGANQTEITNSFNYEYEVEGKVGAGAGGFTVGVIAGFGIGAGGGWSSSSSTSYTAIVDNMPEDAEGYSFYWQFGTATAKLNNNNVLMLVYKTKDVKSPTAPPSNLHVESVSSDSVTLEWEASAGATGYKIYQVNSSTGAKLLIDTLPGGVTSYTDETVSPNTSYTYCLMAYKGSSPSIMTREVTATTLSNDMKNFSIIKHPEDTSTYVLGSAEFSVSAQCLKNSGEAYSLRYQWQQYDKDSRSWVECDAGKNGSSTYTVTNVQKSDDGTKYRCLVYVNASLMLYSEAAELTIGKASSSSTLSASLGDTALTNNNNVKTSYIKSENVTIGKENVVKTETINGTEYTVYECKISDSEKFTLYYNGNKYFVDIEKFAEETNNTSIPVTLTGMIEMIVESEEDSLSYTYSYSDTGGETKEENVEIAWSSLTKDSAYTSGSKTFYLDDDGNLSSATTSKTVSASEKYDVTENSVTTSFYKCTVTETDNNTSSMWIAVRNGNAYEADLQESTYMRPNFTGTNAALNSKIKLYFAEITEATEEKDVTTTVETTVAGDTVTLTANVGSKQSTLPSGNVTFNISNGSNVSNEMVQIGSDGKATLSWNPTSSGVYTITASYNGNDLFRGSTSNSITLNVITPYEKSLVLSGSDMTYGDEDQKLILTLLDGKISDDNSSGISVTSEAVAPKSYTAKYSDGTSAEGTVSLSSDSKTILFKPNKAGTYSITAEYESDLGEKLTATSSITVKTRSAVVAADDIKTQIGTSKNMTYTLSGVLENDKSLFDGKVTLTCSDNGNNATEKGEFTITVSVNSDSSITDKYSVSVKYGKCTVVEDAYAVYNYTDDANGKVTLNYSADGMSASFDSGDLVPKGSTITAVAKPAEGYAVKSWYIAEGDAGRNGTYQPVYVSGSTGILNKLNTWAVSESLDKSYSIKAEFELVYYGLEFEMDNGSVTAQYVSSSGIKGESFSSGSKLNPLQTVQLTAKPDDGYVIKEWRIYEDDSSGYTTIKADNALSNYTGDTYTVSNISAKTKIEVITENASAATVNVSFEDSDGNMLTDSNMGVSFNGTAAAGNEGVFTYTGNSHDNVTIKLTIPESLIVESWNDVTVSGSDKTYNVITSDLKDQKKTYVISDLSADRNIVVKCAAPNSYTVTTSTTLFGEDSDVCGTVAVYKSNSDTALTSGDKVAQASVLRVVATPYKGYDLKWLYVNNIPVDTIAVNGSSESSYTIDGISGETVIRADFSKRPVITLNAEGLENSDKATVTAAVDGSGIATLDAAGTVAYKSKDDIVISAVAPEGYEVTGFTVDSSDVDGEGNDDDNNRTYTVKAGENGITSDITVTAKFRKLKTYSVSYSVVDTNGQEDGGLNGALSLSASRKGYTDSIVTMTAVLGGDIEYEIYEGSNVNITITPDTGYRLQHLLVDGVDVTDGFSGNIYTFENLDKDHSVKAQFEEIGNKIYFSAENTEDSKGSVTASYKTEENGEEKTFESGNSLYTGSITFTAKPDEGYRVAGWYIDNTLQKDESGAVITDNKFVYAPDSEDTGAVIVVKFEKSHYSIKFDIANIGGSADDELWGTVKASKKAIADGDSVDAVNGNDFTFTVTPDSDHMIDYVKIDGVEFTEASDSLKSAEITIPKVAASASVEVRFAEIPSYTVTVGVEGNGSVICGTDKISTNGVKTIDVKYGESITLKAEASEYNTLLGWKQEGSDGYVSKDEKYTFKPSSAITLTAVFGEEAAYSAGYINPDDGILRMTIDNTPYTGAVVDGKCENNNVAEGSKIVFTAVPDPEPNKKTSVYDWYINGQSVCGYSNIAVASVVAKSSNTSKKVIDDVEYEITDTGKTLTILSLEKNVEVGVVFWESEPYDITYVDGTDTNAVQKAERWSTATITVGNGYTFNASKLAEAVGDNAEYTVTKNSDGSVTMEFKNIIGDIDTTSAFTKKPASTGGGGGGGAVASDEYTVKFVTGWFTKPADQKVAQGKKVTEPKLEDHGNYTLEGWYSDAEYTKPYSFSSAVKSDMTLYAKWKLNIGSEDEHACAAFADIAEHWAKDYICFVVESGLMNGVGEDRFAPETLLSRGMLVTVLWRADGSPEIADSQQAAGFADVEDGKWYADAVAWASANGIVTGYTSADGSQQLFGPDNSITREQFAAIMYRYAKYKGCDIAEGGTEAQKYSDYGEISSYAKSAVEWAVSTGLITGVSDTRLAPQGSATRAQTAAILQRFAEKIM